MRVLLAGASGAIGKHLIPELIASGHEVVGITRTPGSLDGTGATELVADVSHRRSFLAAVEGVSANAVIHEATSLSKPSLTFRHMRQTNRLRSEGTSTLLAAARRMGAARFVTASAVYGYGFGDAGNDVLDETAPYAQPDGTRNDPVLAALLTNEQQVRAFGGVALRYGIFYQPGARDASPVPRHWNGLLPVVHLRDAARATVLAMERGKPGEAYNIVDDEPVTWRELQEMQARADGLPSPIVVPDWLLRRAAPFGAQLMTTMSLQLSNQKARRDLKWKPEYPSLREGLPLGAERSPEELATMKADRAKADAARKAAAKKASAARAAALKAAAKAEAKADAAASESAASKVEAAGSERLTAEAVSAGGRPPIAASDRVKQLSVRMGEFRARMEERAAARAARDAERAAARASEQAAVWAAERAARRAAEAAAERAATEAAEEAERDAIARAALAAAESALDAAEETQPMPERGDSMDVDLSDYSDSGSYSGSEPDAPIPGRELDQENRV